MKSIIISDFKDTSFSLSEIVSLLHEAFKEREQQGIRMGGSTITEEELATILEDAVLFTASCDGLLIGMLSARYSQRELKRKTEKYCHLGYVAVTQNEKRGGIGGRLLEHLEKDAIGKGCSYIISNTAEPAKSAVAWHLKHGFRKIKYTHWKSREYNSIVFRKELSHSFRKSFPIISDLLYLRPRLSFKLQA